MYFHTRLVRPCQRSTLPEHVPSETQVYQVHGPQWCPRQLEQLFADRVLGNLRGTQGIVNFRER